MGSGTCVHTLRGHNDEILDVSFNTTGSKLVTASADHSSRVYNTTTGACHAILAGHEGEISKVGWCLVVVYWLFRAVLRFLCGLKGILLSFVKHY